MLRRSRFMLFLLCALSFALQPASAQEHYSLQYRFAQGKTYRYADSIAVKSSQEINGQEMKMTSTVLSTTRIVALALAGNGTATLMISPDAVRISVQSPQGDTTIVPKEMVGKRTRYTVSKLGEAVTHEVIDTVKLSGLAGNLAQRNSFRFHAFPAKPVAIGEKWTATRPDTSEAMGSKVASMSTIEYTLLSKDRARGKEVLKISYTAKITITGKGSMMGSDFFIEGSGSSSGKMFVDPDNGLPVSEESTTDMESTVALTGAQNMTIPSSQSVTVHRILLGD